MNEILYETKKLKIKRAIAKLQNINVKEADVFLKNYQNIVNQEKSENTDDLLEQLKELESSMKEFDEYFKLINQVNYLKGSIKIQNDDIEKQIKTTYELIKNYLSLKKENPNLKIEDIYSVIYETIKKEILLNNESQLVDIIKEDELFCYNMSEYIENDIKQLNEAINDIPFLNQLNTKVSEINMRGTSAHLVNEDIIRLIVKSNNYKELKEKYTKEVKKIEESINVNLNNIDNMRLKSELNYLDETLRNLKKKIDYFASEEFTSRITSLILSTLVFGGIFIGIPKVSKNLSKTNEYKTTTEIYVVGETEKDPLVDYQRKLSKEVTRTLEIGGELKERLGSDDYRRIYYYDLTDILLDSIEKYANIDVNYYGIESRSKYIYESENAFDVEYMTEGKRRMTIVTQDLNDSRVAIKKVQNIIINVAAYIVYAGILLFGKKISPLHILEKLIKEMRENENDIEKFNKTLKDLLNNLDDLETYLSKNQKLIEEYKQIQTPDLSDYIEAELIEQIDENIKKNEQLENTRKKMLVWRNE